MSTFTPASDATTTTPVGQLADPVLVGAGGIATSGSGDTTTANLLDSISGTVFTAGQRLPRRHGVEFTLHAGSYD
ncbi:hypothetical protein FBY35_3917 [Streptomyces sp. SLBN-118]|uniref:hypothetical protein n=1 Tax=Streptomyces sp. SLBN-118 TaxID=2768454 RepID=UPI001152098E|nr:hypothetical protein [Streptomyces sp. SLBN-118]TQK42503.1 hypothetical protein FBY35_3917 [Streptomyces sp. SLBN-118]